MAVERLTLTAQGQVRYRLKTSYRDGTTHIVLEPLDFLARLAALVPPAHRGVGARGVRAASGEPDKPPTPRHVALSWARRRKRVFGIEIECGARCGGKLRILASIEEPAGTAVADAVAVNRRMQSDDVPPRHEVSGRRGAVPVWGKCRATD